MVKRPVEDPRISAVEPGLRPMLRRLREIMAEPGDGQSRLDKIVRQTAGLMVAEVCSIYLKRQDGNLELFATEGLNQSAVHNTFMKRGEGLVGRCAELAVPVNEPEAQSHPAFSYRPETGEEIYHSFLAVPILRGGDVLGVMTVQNKTQREYSDDDVEALQTTAMVLAEHLVSGAVAGANTAAAFSRSVAHVVRGQTMSDGLALGHVVLHEPRVVITDLRAEDPEAEAQRLDAAVAELKVSLDELLGGEKLAEEGEHRDVLEAYRMFANDRGWLRRLKDTVKTGLTAEAAVDLVQNQTRSRMLRQAEPFWRERVRDLDDLSDRLLRILAARKFGESAKKDMPHDAVLVARGMGAAELLDYDRARLRGLVVEDGSGQSHVAIVARALGIAAVGQARGVIERVDPGDPIIVDAATGEVHIRPTSDVIAAYADKARFQARRQRQYKSLRELPALSKDGQRIELHINAGLPVDMTHIAEAGADGIGLFRTELQFMIASSFPRIERQLQLYRTVVTEARGKPVVFRTLDIGGDKVLPYLRRVQEENPALGWRGIRMALDRPALFRTQVRALIRAAAGAELRIMVPMVSEASEVAAARLLVDREFELARRRGIAGPKTLAFGIMIEVPSLLFQLDAVMKMVDFVSVGSNDLMQYLFAADRSNERVAARFDTLSPIFLRALGQVIDAGKRHRVPVALCGEVGGKPLEALALVALGFRSLSMAPASIGPVKAMIRSMHVKRVAERVRSLVAESDASIRDTLKRFAEAEGIEM
ncbi:MAG TPA: phosphoenolpyruvate--protein phosphotransferase [Hyphomicrobiaceae bacterium]